MVINTNLSALNTATLLMQSQRISARLATVVIRLKNHFTGRRQRRPGSVHEVKRTDVPHDAASNNVNNAISFSQTQDGYVQQVNSAFSRMSELSVLAQDVTKTTSDRALVSTGIHRPRQLHQQCGDEGFQRRQPVQRRQLNVTTDSEANTFGMKGIDLANTTYANGHE